MTLAGIAATAIGFMLRIAIRGYQLMLAPVLPPSCRYLPSCSHYADEAIARHGALRGSLLALKRVCRCHPWGGSGYDPVPDFKCGSTSVLPSAPARSPTRPPNQHTLVGWPGGGAGWCRRAARR